MKRFGTYNEDFANLFECYAKVNTMMSEVTLPSLNRKHAPTFNKTPSYDGLKVIKIMQHRPSGGAEFTHACKLLSVDHDDGQGNVILTAEDQNKRKVQITISGNSTIVKFLHSTGSVVEVQTSIPVMFDETSGELTIVNSQ